MKNVREAETFSHYFVVFQSVKERFIFISFIFGKLENKRPAFLHGGERGGTGNLRCVPPLTAMPRTSVFGQAVP